MLGPDMFTLWKTEGIPVIPLEEQDYRQALPFQFPEPGCTIVGIWSRAPEKVLLEKAKEKGIDLAEFQRKTFGDENGMHTTDTIDYNIVISGEVWMELDDGVEVHLKPFDCVVQNGTRHAWRNRGSERCFVAFIAIGAKRKKN